MNCEEEVQRIGSFIKSQCMHKGAVLGVSGGIDSTVVAYLLQMFLPQDRILFVSMPNGSVLQNSDLARAIALITGVELDIVEINTIQDAYLDQLDHNKMKKGDENNALGNLSARIRKDILYFYANVTNSLVIGTTNLSEMEMGYFTKFGDGAVDIEPIAHLYKTEIYELAKYLNIPKNLIDQVPSAGLYVGQTDENEIGVPYEDIDRILDRYPCYPGVIEDCEKKEKIVCRWRESTQHKRELPPRLERLKDDGKNNN